MDATICTWIAEFILRNEIDDDLTKRVITALSPAIDGNSRLKKTLLLREIHSLISEGSIKEKLLDYLDCILELDSGGVVVSVSPSLKRAYCDVAVACSVQILGEKAGNLESEDFDSVVMVWRERVREMEEILGEPDLVHQKLAQHKTKIDASLCDHSMRHVLLENNCRGQALTSLRTYVAEEWKKMGSSFLEAASTYISEDNVNKQQLPQPSKHPSRLSIPSETSELSDSTDNETSGVRKNGKRNLIKDVQAQTNAVTYKSNDLIRSRPSIMNRNSTACTHEWNDSIEGLPDRIKLNVRRRQRRKVKRWSVLEEDTLRHGVKRYGMGNWKVILKCYNDIFDGRSEVDLKDKWRNLTRKNG